MANHHSWALTGIAGHNRRWIDGSIPIQSIETIGYADIRWYRSISKRFFFLISSINYHKNGTARIGEHERDSQNSASRTGRPEEDCQHRTARTVLLGQDSQSRTAGAGQPRQDRKDGTAVTGQPVQTARKGEP
jgi:hypothetical protein